MVGFVLFIGVPMNIDHIKKALESSYLHDPAYGKEVNLKLQKEELDKLFTRHALGIQIPYIKVRGIWFSPIKSVSSTGWYCSGIGNIKAIRITNKPEYDWIMYINRGSNDDPEILEFIRSAKD